MSESEHVNNESSPILLVSVNADNFLSVSDCLKITLKYQISIKISVDLTIYQLVL